MEEKQINLEQHYRIEYKLRAICKTPCHKCGGKIMVRLTRRDNDGTYRIFACDTCDVTFTRHSPDEPFES
jgi:RecJ-like exonuclease